MFKGKTERYSVKNVELLGIYQKVELRFFDSSSGDLPFERVSLTRLFGYTCVSLLSPKDGGTLVIINDKKIIGCLINGTVHHIESGPMIAALSGLLHVLRDFIRTESGKNMRKSMRKSMNAAFSIISNAIIDTGVIVLSEE